MKGISRQNRQKIAWGQTLISDQTLKDFCSTEVSDFSSLFLLSTSISISDFSFPCEVLALSSSVPKSSQSSLSDSSTSVFWRSSSWRKTRAAFGNPWISPHHIRERSHGYLLALKCDLSMSIVLRAICRERESWTINLVKAWWLNAITYPALKP